MKLEFNHKKGIYCQMIFPLTAITVFMFILPRYGNPYLLHIAILMLLYAYLASSWNIVAGYTGQFSFGNAAFFGIGAYASSNLALHYGITPWIGMIVGGIIACLLGALEGYLTLRYGLTGWHFSITTWAFAEALRIIALNLGSGAAGIIIPLKVQSWSNFQFSSREPYLYIIFLLTVGVLLVSFFIQNSSFGLRCIAIREDVDTAEASGIKTGATKIFSLALSAFLTALGGTFYAQYLTYIDPNLAFGMDTSIEMIMRSVVGGIGTIWGPFIGSLILTPVGELLNYICNDKVIGANLVFFGIILILIMKLKPQGILGSNLPSRHLGGINNANNT